MYFKYLYNHINVMSKIFNLKTYNDNIIFDVMESKSYNNGSFSTYLQSYRIFISNIEINRIMEHLECSNFANITKYGEVEKLNTKYC